MRHRTHRPTLPQAGFTLIEIIVVVTLSVMLTMAATGLFLATLVGSSKKEQISQIRSEGDYALEQMEFLLRNAVSLVANPNAPTNPICTGGMSSISLKSYDDGITTFSVDPSGRIASQSGTSNINNVSISSIDVTVSPALTFDCQRSSSSTGTYVHISFGLSKNVNSTHNGGFLYFNNPNPVNVIFDGAVSMRNY